MNVATIGGGAVGLTVARDLADRGAAVTLYERGEPGGDHASTGRAAGVCYDAFPDRVDADLAARALERFRAFSGEGGFRFTDCPYVWLAREGDDRRGAAVREGVERMREHDRDVALVDPAELRERFPALRTDDVAVAAIARDAGYADPAAYAELLADRAAAAGVGLRTGVAAALDLDGDLPRVRTPDGTAGFDAVAVAAGAHTRQVLAGAGVPVPVKPYRVQALVTEPTPAGDCVPTCYDATGGYYLRPRDGGLLLGDGTEPVERDPDDWTREADEWFLAAAADHLRAAIGTAPPVARAWAGLCTATPDGHPLVGEAAPGVYVATGWQGHGFMRAPAVGETLAEQVLGGEGIGAFDPGRFDGDEEFEIVEGMALDGP